LPASGEAHGLDAWLIKEVWAFRDYPHRGALSGMALRSCGNENWEFGAAGLMRVLCQQVPETRWRQVRMLVRPPAAANGTRASMRIGRSLMSGYQVPAATVRQPYSGVCFSRKPITRSHCSSR